MTAQEFKKYEGKETTGHDFVGKDLTGGIVVGYSESDADLLVKLPDSSGNFKTIFEKVIPNEEELALYNSNQIKISYWWCSIHNVKI